MTASFRYLLFSILAMVTLLIGTCTQPPEYPDTPVLEFVANSKDSIFQQSTGLIDTILIRFSFTDGDGDLSLDVADSTDIVVSDLRFPDLPIGNVFRLPEIPEEGTGNGISGEVTLIYRNDQICCYETIQGITFACGNAIQNRVDTTQFLIQMRDRAGNWSNEITTDPIYVICVQ